MGPLISAKQRERVLGYIQKGVDEGATLAVGGGRPARSRQGLVRRADPVRRRRQLDDHRPGGDLRARCSSVIPFDDDDDAVRIANDSVYGLSGGVISGVAERAIGSRQAHPHRRRRRSTAASPTAPTCRSAATRTAASVARTASRASSSTSRPSRWPGPDERHRDLLRPLRHRDRRRPALRLATDARRGPALVQRQARVLRAEPLRRRGEGPGRLGHVPVRQGLHPRADQGRHRDAAGHGPHGGPAHPRHPPQRDVTRLHAQEDAGPRGPGPRVLRPQPRPARGQRAASTSSATSAPRCRCG